MHHKAYAVFLNSILLSIIFTTSDACPCGKRRFVGNDEKIVGGHLSRRNAWPWTVALVYVGYGSAQQFCGGSLIDERNILTAGHCVHEIVVQNESLANYKVFMGDIKLNGSATVRHNIEAIKIHPWFNPDTLANDIAIVRLANKVRYSESVQPICLHQPTGQRLQPQQPAIVVGWGAVRDDGPTVNSQRQVAIQLIPTNECRSNYRKVGFQVTPENMICAGSRNKDSCAGDSGGPLFLKRKNENSFEQIGIVSFGRQCAERGFPGVYTKINTFRNFIQRHSQDAGHC